MFSLTYNYLIGATNYYNMLRDIERLADEPIIVMYGIKGFPHHFMTDKGLIQITHCPGKRTLPTKFLSMIRTGSGGRCRGYQIHGKFRSLTWLEKRMFPRTLVIQKRRDYHFN